MKEILYLFKSKLARRTVVYVLLFSSVITLFFTSLQLYRDYQDGLTRIEQEMDEIASTSLKALEENLWMLNLSSIELMLEGILQNKDIVYLEILDEKGRPLIRQGKKPKKNFRERNLNLTYSVDGREVPLGQLKIAATLENVYNELLDTFIYILVTQTIKTFFVSTFILFIVWSLISRHLTAIQNYTNNLRLGAPLQDLRLSRKENHWTKDDELSALVYAINRMRKEIDASYSHIRHLYLHDTLTRLPNRRLLEEHLQQQAKNHNRSRSHGALLFIDLDHFKLLNESLGHSIGDQLLIEVARRLSNLLDYPENEKNLVARIGGDEFIVLLNDLPDDENAALRTAKELAGSFQRHIARNILIAGKKYRITASIGIVLYGNGECDCEALLKQADNALHEAKAMGRNRIVVFQPEMQQKIDQRFETERRLHIGIQKHQFLLHLQPKVNRAMTICSAEVLVRWQQEDGSLVPPNLFIPIAEETGLIVEIGQQILVQTFDMISGNRSLLQNRDLTSISVNVSAHQFHDPGFVDFVIEQSRKYRIDPEFIILEITEEAMVQDVDLTMQAMQKLKNHGFRLSIDDFGTGYSSMRYLKDFPLDELKIDKSFIDHIVENSNDQAIARSIIDLAQNLNLDVVAEGVETEEQYRLLQEMGCKFYQGFLFSPPLTQDEFIWRIRSQALRQG